MIKIRDVCKSFGSHEALKHINLDIVEGETLAIIGGSGSGKSTLLRLLIGLDRPTSGEIYIMGSPIANMSEKQLDELRMNMGMVFQYSALFDSMTVGENVAFGLREHRGLHAGGAVRRHEEACGAGTGHRLQPENHLL